MAPTVDSYDTIYGSLAGQYQPQTDLVNTQLAQLPTQQAAQQASLDQAKVNAFKDITNQSNSRGVLFSGVPIDQQATYTGTKYLPAVANMQTSFNNQKTSLLGSLNNINAQRMTTARGIQSNQQSNLTAYQKAQSDAAYKNAQLQLSAQRNAISASKGSGGITPYQQANLASKAAAQYKLTYKPNNAGYAFTGPNGVPISAYQYAQATGNSLLDLLKNSPSQYDQNAYNQAIGMHNQGYGEDQILNALSSKYKALF